MSKTDCEGGALGASGLSQTEGGGSHGAHVLPLYLLAPDNAAPACSQRALTPARSYSGLTPVLLRSYSGLTPGAPAAPKMGRAPAARAPLLLAPAAPNPPPADSESESGPYSRILHTLGSLGTTTY